MPAAFYGPDLAFIHDAGFLGFARQAAPWVVKRLARRCEPAARVVEIGCGSGALTRELAAAGYRVLGVDASPAMIRLARRQSPAGHFRLARWQEFSPPPCDAIVAVGECFNYLSATPARHQRALVAFFNRARAALRPGGLLLFDLLVPHPDIPTRRAAISGGADWSIRAEIRERGGVITRRMTLVRDVAGRDRVSHETHRQCRLAPAPVTAALRTAGFIVTWRDGFGRRHLPPGHVVVEALRGYGRPVAAAIAGRKPRGAGLRPV